MSYKIRKGLNPHKIFTSKDLKSFKETLCDNQKNHFYTHGFQILTTKKNYVLFTEKYEDYLNWIRILKYFFYKIDIFNQFSGLSLSNNLTIFESKSVIPLAEDNHKTSKRNERGVEYKYYLVPKSTLTMNEAPSNLPSSNEAPSNEAPQSKTKFNDDNQKVGVEYPDNYQGDYLEVEQIESPVRIENKKVISNVITHLKTEIKNNFKDNVDKNLENNNRLIETSNDTHLSQTNITKIKSNININKEIHEFDNINSNSPLKPSFLLDLKKNQKSSNVNFIRNIIERKTEIEVNEVVKSDQDILNIKSNDSSYKASNQANAPINDNNLPLKNNSDHELNSQIKNNSYNLLNGKSSRMISQIGLSEIYENAEFHRKELSNDSQTVKKMEKVEMYELERAFIKNTNKITFGNNENEVQYRDYIANYIGNDVNGLGIPNVSYKRVVSTNMYKLNIDNKVKENNKSILEASKKLNLNDQKIFKISSDFAVENKVKTLISAKIPLISNDEDDNIINNTSFNKYELNSDQKVRVHETNSAINQNIIIKNEETQLNLINKEEHMNTDQTNKFILNKSFSPNKSLNENTLSNRSSINATSQKAKNYFNENDKIQVNNSSKHHEKRETFNWTNNQSSIREYTDIYLKNTKKVIEKKTIESSNTSKPVKTFHEIDFADPWINENVLIYPNQKRTVSAESHNNYYNKTSNKELRENSYVEFNKDQHTEINKHKLKINSNFHFIDDNLHVHSDEIIVKKDETRTMIGKDQKGKHLSQSFYRDLNRKNDDKTNSEEYRILNSAKTKNINRESTTLVEHHHLVPNYSFNNNDENEGKTFKIEEPIRTIKGNKGTSKEESLEKRIEKDDNIKVKFKIVEEEWHESAINKKNLK